MSHRDIVIPVRPGDDNNELRYSLRSIAAHVPHRYVWIAGHRPTWVSPEVRWIPVDQAQHRSHRYTNSRANRRAACEHPQVSEEFLLFNDDFFVMRAIAEMPVLHRGPIDELVQRQTARIGGRTSAYVKGGLETAQWLLNNFGIDGPLSYELHAPMLMQKRRLLRVLDHADESGMDIPHIRTMYGNMYAVGGEQTDDVKVHDLDTLPADDALLVSTTRRAFDYGAVGRWLRSRLNEPGPYELVDDLDEAV